MRGRPLHLGLPSPWPHSPPALPKLVSSGRLTHTSSHAPSGIDLSGNSYTSSPPGALGSPMRQPPSVYLPYFFTTYSTVWSPPGLVQPAAPSATSPFFRCTAAPPPDGITLSLRSARTTKVWPPTLIAAATFDVAPRYLTFAASTVWTVTLQPQPGSSTVAKLNVPIPMKSNLPGVRPRTYSHDL